MIQTVVELRIGVRHRGGCKAGETPLWGLSERRADSWVMGRWCTIKTYTITHQLYTSHMLHPFKPRLPTDPEAHSCPILESVRTGEWGRKEGRGGGEGHGSQRAARCENRLGYDGWRKGGGGRTIHWRTSSLFGETILTHRVLTVCRNGRVNVPWQRLGVCRTGWGGGGEAERVGEERL